MDWARSLSAPEAVPKAISGIPASREPTGQSLQNHGSPVTEGRKIIIKKKMKYLTLVTGCGIFILRVLIRFRSAWTSPNGQSQPQTSLPNKSEIEIRKPKTNWGITVAPARCLYVNMCCDTPTGQENVAEGQLWQFMKGAQKRLAEPV